MKRNLLSAILLLTSSAVIAQKQISVTVTNPSSMDKKDAPVVLKLDGYGFNVKSAIVKEGEKEIPCQIDDLNKDGKTDELCFVVDLDKKQQKTFSVSLLPSGKPLPYTPRTYAEMILPNKRVKIKNKQDIYLSSITVEKGSASTYSSLHHHGVAFESELTAFRIYFDHRQTIDLYGKFNKQLELKETQFYPDKEQKAKGYGDDVLWVGNTFGLGAMRGWNGTKQQLLEDVEYRTQRVIAKGPVRAIVEVMDEGWTTDKSKDAIDMTVRYTIYAGHRDCHVDVFFRQPVDDYRFSTGIINVKGSEEMSDHKGLRGCWGSDWPVAAKDSAGHKRETVGLGIYVPDDNRISEVPTDGEEYPFVIGTKNQQIKYYITFTSDNETFGYHSAKDWFQCLKEWRKDIDKPVVVEIRQ